MKNIQLLGPLFKFIREAHKIDFLTLCKNVTISFHRLTLFEQGCREITESEVEILSDFYRINKNAFLIKFSEPQVRLLIKIINGYEYVTSKELSTARSLAKRGLFILDDRTIKFKREPNYDLARNKISECCGIKPKCSTCLLISDLISHIRYLEKK